MNQPKNLEISNSLTGVDLFKSASLTLPRPHDRRIKMEQNISYHPV